LGGLISRDLLDETRVAVFELLDVVVKQEVNESGVEDVKHVQLVTDGDLVVVEAQRIQLYQTHRDH
jgi:hypothetical protein